MAEHVLRGILFKSKTGNKYFYDDNTGIINPIQGEFNHDYFINKYKNIYDSINSFYADNKSHQCSANALKQYLIDEANGFKQLTIEVTTECNLRCKYCIFSDHYQYTRTYTNINMDYETARTAVDYYMENFKKVAYRNPTLKPVIGFYGGEPLLNFDLIKQVVTYIEEKYEDYEVLYNITTNGVLFNKEIQDYLVEHDFAILVSLDGDRENHDRNRVTIDGSGSFDIIMKNILLFKQNHPNYVKFSFSVCTDYKTDLLKLEDFFNRNDLFVARCTPVDETNTTYYEQFSREDVIKYFEKDQIIKEKFQKIAVEGNIQDNKFLFCMLGSNYLEFAFHPVINDRRPWFSPYSGTCMPGEKIFVSVNGDIHICERVNQNYAVGNIYEGLDYERAAELVNEYNNAIMHKCKNCCVSKFCNLCFSKCFSEKIVSLPDKYCEIHEENIKSMLIDFINILEGKSDVFESITIDYYKNLYERAGETIGC